MDYTMESFIQWCDDITIAEEGIIENIQDQFRLSIDLDKAVKANDLKGVIKLSSHNVPIIEVPNDDVMKKAVKKSKISKAALITTVIATRLSRQLFLVENPYYYLMLFMTIDIDNVVLLGEMIASRALNGLLYKYRPYNDEETNKIYLIHNSYKIPCKKKEFGKLELTNESAIDNVKDVINKAVDKYRLSMDLDKAIPAKDMSEVLFLANRGAPIIQTPNDAVAKEAIMKSKVGKVAGLPVMIAAKAAKLIAMKECDIYCLLIFRMVDVLHLGVGSINLLLNGFLMNYKPYATEDGIIYLINNSIKVSKV